MDSRAWRKGDPADLMDRSQRMRQLEAAKAIFKLAPSEWEKKIEQLPKDWRANVQEFLQELKQYAKSL